MRSTKIYIKRRQSPTQCESNLFQCPAVLFLIKLLHLLLGNTEACMRAPDVPDDCVIALSVADVSKTFKQVNIHKDAGPNGLPGCVLRACADQLASVFTDIFNMSLTKSVIPMSRINPLRRSRSPYYYAHLSPPLRAPAPHQTHRDSITFLITFPISGTPFDSFLRHYCFCLYV